MMWKSIRGLAVIVGALIVAFVGMIAVEGMSAVLHPFPPGVDPTNLEACREHVARYPGGVLLLCAMGWWLTVFVSSALATRLGVNRHPVHGLVVGSILLALAIFNMAMLPYPAWFWVNLVTFPLSCLAGIWLGRLGMRRAIPPV
jgi:hypothetical protein